MSIFSKLTLKVLIFIIRVMDKLELKKIVRDSSLEENDKKEWEVLIDSMPEDAAEALFRMFTEFPDEIGWFNEIHKKKKEAFSLMRQDAVKGKAFFEEIAKEEKEKLKDLAR